MADTYDVESVRALFPAARRMTYLDSAFQTPMSVPVRTAIESFLEESSTQAGPKSVWLEEAERVRTQVAALFHASPAEIAFTKNTSEAMNIAASALPLRPGENVLMVQGDHPNNAYAFLNLKRKGVELRFIPMLPVMNADSFRPHIDSKTRAISMSYVTFHAGHRFDVASVGALCRERRLDFVVDVMQAVGVVPIDVRKIGATFVGCGTHKGLLVPHGLGLLWWDSHHTEMEPAYLATASLANAPADLIANPDDLTLAASAKRFELGNLNLLGIRALGAALDLIARVGVEAICAHCFDLGDRLIEGLEALDVGLVGPRERRHRAPHIIVAALDPVSWAADLAREGIRVSPERGGIRLSLGMFNDASDIARFLDVMRRRAGR
ncbi:MAG: aminotransferase class V-fold PLP-dependent enzyme [Candidimonas sp.]|nr:MAG: aminotransferase class V-fold PLP-dependent enzyme [Candidimonas sp.]